MQKTTTDIVLKNLEIPGLVGEEAMFSTIQNFLGTFF
jgi:hypothetical protein